jgi:UDP-N-acetylglucosamine acyltransferase
MARVHSTALVGPDVVLAGDAVVGPFVVMEGRVEVGAGAVIDAHSVVRGNCVIGAGCRIGPSAYVGMNPQHGSFDVSAETWTLIGEKSILRETATVHRATKPGRENATLVGPRCHLMTSVHIAHDCRLGVGVTLASSAVLGGHVTIGDFAFIGGAVAIHQNCRVGRLAIIAGNELLAKDLPPFAAFLKGRLKGYNTVGCRRGGLTPQAVRSIRSAYRLLHTHRTTSAAVAAIRAMDGTSAEVEELLAFIATSKRGIPRSAACDREAGE